MSCDSINVSSNKNMNSLPDEIIWEISKYISLKDIVNLKRTSSILNDKINRIQKNIVIYNMKVIGKTNGIYLENLWTYLNNYLSECIKKYRKMFNKEFYWSKNLYNDTFFKYYIIELDRLSHFTDKVIINKVFNKLLRFYVTNNFCDMRSYSNHLELFVFYNFIKIKKRDDMYNIEYYFNFLESLNNDLYYNIKINYYKYILNLHHVCTLSFDKMYKISKYITTISNIKKLMSYKVLELSNSILHMCCVDCDDNNLYDICIMKRNFYKDDLISHNYNELKTFLKNENPYYYGILKNNEDTIVNDMIYIKDPYTNRRVRVNGNRFKNLMEVLMENTPKYNIKIKNLLNHQRAFFKNKFFT